MKLISLPRVRLATLPTPLHRAERLSRLLGGPEIWFKRDDLTGLGLGGNKIRKLEFLAADALAQGADTLVTGAGPQSNHVRATMAVAAHLGLKGVAVLHGSRPPGTQGNLLLDQLLGAEIIFSDNPDRSQLDARIVATGERLRAAGRRPYVIGRGGASPLGCTGYVLASLELLAQLVELNLQPDYLFCATGSCGTHAGLLVGAKWLQMSYQLCGVTVSRPREECLTRIEKLAKETTALLDLQLDISVTDIVVYDDYIGPGYGIPTPACLEAIKLVAQTEGIFLDPVYSGKAMAGLIDLIKREKIAGNETVLFLHTGGAPSVFAYSSELIGPLRMYQKTRPSAKPRFGSVCERLFGTANTTFVHNLVGNTQLMAEVRQVTKTVNPKQLAVWDLGRLYQRLGEWAYEVYDTMDHPALGQSPREGFVSGMARSGQRPQRLIPYDAEFQMLTLPTTAKGTAVVQVNRGVKINSIYYWADAFRDREVERSRVAVRYDPFDISLAYAFVKQHWVSCVSEYYADFKGRSEREVRLASQELRQRQLNYSRQFSLTARKLAEFLTSLEAEEILLAQRLQDVAMKAVITPPAESYPEVDRLAVPTFTAQTNLAETTENWAIYEDF